MIIQNGICHQTFACGFPKKGKHFVFVKTFLSVWSFFLEILTNLKKTNKIRPRILYIRYKDLSTPPPQARNTLSIFLRNNNSRIRQSRIFKHFAPARLLSERCTIFHKVAHPSVSLPSYTRMSLKMIKTEEDIMDCSQGSSGGSDFDYVGTSDSLEELSLLNGE